MRGRGSLGKYVEAITEVSRRLRHQVSRLRGAVETRDGFAKIAVAGHRDSGKSTELNRVFDELEQKGYEVLLAEVNKNLDPNEISISDVVRLIV